MRNRTNASHLLHRSQIQPDGDQVKQHRQHILLLANPRHTGHIHRVKRKHASRQPRPGTFNRHRIAHTNTALIACSNTLTAWYPVGWLPKAATPTTMHSKSMASNPARPSSTTSDAAHLGPGHPIVCDEFFVIPNDASAPYGLIRRERDEHQHQSQEPGSMLEPDVRDGSRRRRR